MIDLNKMDDNSLVEWTNRFTVRIKEYASALGLSDADVQKVDVDSITVGKLADAGNKAKEARADPSIQDEVLRYKELVIRGPADELRKAFPDLFTGAAAVAAAGILPRLISHVGRLKSNPGMTPEIAGSLGIDDTTIDKLKGGESDSVGWFGNFIDKIKTHKAALGLRDSDVQGMDTDYKAYRQVTEQTGRAQNDAPSHPRLQELLKYKDMIVNGPSDAAIRAFPAIAPAAVAVAPGIIPRIDAFIRRLMSSGRFNDTIGRALGVTGEERVPVGAGSVAERGVKGGAAESAAVARPEMPAIPTWLLPAVMLAVLALLAALLWSRSVSRVPSVPAGVALGPLAVAGVSATPARKEANINWESNRPATGQVAYGTTPSLEKGVSPRTVNTEGSNLVRDHSLKLMGLNPGTRYYYRAISRDSKGNEARTDTSSFVTR